MPLIVIAITINGTGHSSGGAIIFTANDNIYSGAITLGATSTIVSTGGAQRISGTINGGQALTITANDNLIIEGVVGGSTPLSSLVVTTTGSAIQTFIANVTTTGNQTYTAAGGIVARPSYNSTRCSVGLVSCSCNICNKGLNCRSCCCNY